MAVKVLILENNPVARNFIGRVVRESFSDAISITEAGDAEAARRELAQAGAEPFKLLLLDLELPDGNALELLAELAHYPATRVVTTLFPDDDESLFPALLRGAGGYLLKEDRFELLVEELQRIVRGQPPLSPALARRLLAHYRAGTPDTLTPRESEVLTFLSKGFTLKEIAGMLSLQWSSVGEHIRALYRKLGATATPGTRRQPA
jgi:DNA-binding NarL/FixJ family response regulator